MKKSFNAYILVTAMIISFIAFSACNKTQTYDVAVPPQYLETFPSDSSCGNFTCAKPLHNQTDIWCRSSDSCKNLGNNCDCKLWGLDKDTKKWKRFGTGKHPYDPGQYIYKCDCGK